MIAAIGDLVEDVVAHLGEAVRPRTDTPAEVLRRRGGSAANVAVMAARCGARARFIGQVGDDALGDHLLAQLAADGVDLAVRRGGRTGSIIVLVDPGGERSFITDRGASTELAEPDSSWLDAVELLHIPGYSLVAEPLATSTRALAHEAGRNRARLTVDASSTGALVDFGPQRFLDLVAQLTPAALFANTDEAALLGLAPGRPAPGVTTTVIRNGAEATVAVAADGRCHTVPVPAVDVVVDTTGAGDAFAAGWLVASQLGADPVAAIETAHEVAARALALAGAEIEPGAVRLGRARRRGA